MGKAAENQNPPGMLDQGEQKEHNYAFNTFCWIFQLGIWASLITTITLYFLNSHVSTGLYILDIILYIIYLCMEFSSPTSKYLIHKKDDEHMYEKMGTIFKTPPVIKFYGECYHYRTVHYTTHTRNGVQHHTRREKVVTHRETYILPYYSERDVSGLFFLNCDKAYVQRKHYIKLKLKEEINFADEVSYMDYEKEKDDFWRRNRFRDTYFDFKEYREIPGMHHHNLVRLTENEPVFVKFFYFFLCTILTNAECYKSWMNSLCVYQKFKVRKLVSTRYDLNKQTYQGLIPQLHFINQQFNYKPEYYNYINSDMQVQMPTPAELERAKKYKDKIPNYRLTDVGTVIGNPAYSNFEPSAPPPAYADVAGDVALADNQVNADGAVPQGFGQPGFHFNTAPNQQQYPPSPQYPSQQIPLQYTNNSDQQMLLPNQYPRKR